MDSAAIKANVASITGIANKANMVSTVGMVYVVDAAANHLPRGTRLKT